jgi:hypothetical protein
MASYGDDVYVTFEVYGDAIYVTHSADAGQTWEAPVAAFIPPQGRRATIPTVAVDSSGNPYVAYVNTNTSEGDAYYGMVRSENLGLSYLAEVDVSAETAGEEVCECCNGHIDVAANGDVYVAFRNNDLNLRDIWLTRSTDGGNTFASAFDIDETDWTAGVCPSNGPHFVITENKVLTSFFSGAGDAGSGAYFSSFDTNTSEVSATYSVPYSDLSSSSQNRPRVAGSGDTFALVWQENFDGSLEIAMSLSTTGVEALTTEPFLLSDLAGSQQYPSIVFDGSSFHVVYEDSDSGTVLYQEVSFGAVGLAEEAYSSFDLSPNPSAHFINVRRDSSRPARLTIIDHTGRLVQVQAISEQSSRLDVSALESGQYIVLIEEDGILSRERLVISK